MKLKLLVSAVLVALSTLVAAKTVTANAYLPGPDQPTSCTSDFSGKAVPCILRPNANPGELYPFVDFSTLLPGTYIMTLSVSNNGGGACTGGPIIFTCDGGGGIAISPPITIIINPLKATPLIPSNIRVFP